jgi:hypothetical protein
MTTEHDVEEKVAMPVPPSAVVEAKCMPVAVQDCVIEVDGGCRRVCCWKRRAGEVWPNTLTNKLKKSNPHQEM